MTKMYALINADGDYFDFKTRELFSSPGHVLNPVTFNKSDATEAYYAYGGDIITFDLSTSEKLVKVNSQEDEIIKNTEASRCPLQYLAAETKEWNPDRQYKLIKALANGYVKEIQYFVYMVLPGDTAGMTIVQAIKEDGHINYVLYIGSTVRSDFGTDALFTNKEIEQYGLQDLDKQLVGE